MNSGPQLVGGAEQIEVKKKVVQEFPNLCYRIIIVKSLIWSDISLSLSCTYFMQKEMRLGHRGFMKLVELVTNGVRNNYLHTICRDQSSPWFR